MIQRLDNDLSLNFVSESKRELNRPNVLTLRIPVHMVWARALPDSVNFLDRVDTVTRLRINMVGQAIYRFDLALLVDRLASHRTPFVHGCLSSHLCHYRNIAAQVKYKGCCYIAAREKMVRKEILGASERKIVEAYLNGKRVKGYTAVLFRIRKIGLKAIIEGCEQDLSLLKRLLQIEAPHGRVT
jgi:hypothetical protein